jgi:hypothetical protein
VGLGELRGSDRRAYVSMEDGFQGKEVRERVLEEQSVWERLVRGGCSQKMCFWRKAPQVEEAKLATCQGEDHTAVNGFGLG